MHALTEMCWVVLNAAPRTAAASSAALIVKDLMLPGQGRPFFGLTAGVPPAIRAAMAL